MPTLEAGLFVLLSGSGFLMLLLSFKFGALLKVLAAVMFFSVSIVLFSGYEVAYTSEFSGTGQCPASDPCIEQHFLIRADDVTGETYGNWVAWVFIVIGILSALLFILEMVQSGGM